MSHTKLTAFTLLELLVAVAMIAIMAAVGLPYGVSRMCDARHNALASGIDAEIFNARLFALENNRYVKVNLTPSIGGGLTIDRYYNTSNNNNCGINRNTPGSIGISSRDFSNIKTAGMVDSTFCFNSQGMIVQSNYNAVVLLQHSCLSGEYKLRIKFIGLGGFFIIEENLPLMPSGSWRVI